MTTQDLDLTPSRASQIDTSRIWKVGFLAIVVCIAANLLMLALLRILLDLPSSFPPLTAASIIIFTTIGVGLATIAFALVCKFSRNPIRTFWIVAVIAFVVSILPNLMASINPAAAPMPGGTPQAYLVLILFHVVAASISVFMLTTLTRKKEK